MSPSLRTHHFFSTTSESLPVFEVLPIPIVSPPDAMPPRPLQVYHRRPRVVAPLPFAEAPADSLPIPSASPAPALPSPNDLPIAVRKAPMKLFPIQAGDRQWWMKWLLCTLMALGILLFYPLVDRLKARLVAKGYTQVYGSDYGDTFSPVAKIASVRLLLSMAAMCSWPLYQLDIKNAFLHGDLAEEVYIEQPPVLLFKSLACFAVHQTIQFSIIITPWGSTKDLGKLKYFLGIEIAQSNSGVVLSQRKYALDILEETGMLDCKPVDTPMDPNVKLVPGQGEPLGDPGRYRRLSPCDSHWDAVIRILRYIKSTPGQGVLYENRGHTQSKKQYVVADLALKAEYQAMALATCELIWLRHLLRELRFGKDEQMKLICDNQAALHIASNPVFHERTKHIEGYSLFHLFLGSLILLEERSHQGSDWFPLSVYDSPLKEILAGRAKTRQLQWISKPYSRVAFDNSFILAVLDRKGPWRLDPWIF
ncbi:Copia protein [Vitis vinifera]|uniref:Copia protein n=1 Tax=Vitis vinifera TaxID=29760 RepID=A0A438HHA3_VITVI|nr:Copia protein [Vitis vinifera]